MSDLAIIGGFPPPFGGVTTHVQRLLPLLRDRGVSFRVYNAVSESESPPDVVSVASKRRLWLPWFLLRCTEKAIYILSDRIGVWFIAVCIGSVRGKKLALRLRNSVLADIAVRGGWHAWLARLIIPRFDLIVCVTRQLEKTSIDLGADPAGVLYAPGFLPPTSTCTDEKLVERDVLLFVEDRSPIIAANGKVAWHKGQDLYGLDLLVDLVSRLKPDFPDIGLVFCFWAHYPEDEERLLSLIERAEALGVKDSICFNTSPGVFTPILAKSEIFLRPTVTDGDANSIREALALGIPVIASDVVERPDRCLIHKSRDLDSIETLVRECLSNSRRNKVRPEISISNATRKRIETYLDRLELIAE
jgi:glycosyltransferase involved in cell wall biosynthesis